MPTQTYEPLLSRTLTSRTTTVTINSIPQTYDDLVVVMQPGNAASTGNAVRSRLNNDTGNYYSALFVIGASTSGTSARTGIGNQFDLGWQMGLSTTSPNTTTIIHYNQYRAAHAKSVIWRAGGTTQSIEAGTGIWRDNTAINTISFTIGGSGGIDFEVGSVFTVYGIKVA